MDISEKNFEQTIEDALLTNGYCKRNPEHYDKVLCLDPEVVIDFIYATQPKEWEKLKKQHGAEVKDRFFKRLASEIQKRGTLEVLRKGIKPMDVGSLSPASVHQPASTRLSKNSTKPTSSLSSDNSSTVRRTKRVSTSSSS